MFGIPLHTLIVHFPIVLAIVAFVYDAYGCYSGNAKLHRIGSNLTKYASFSAAIATLTGFELAGVSGLGSNSNVTAHAGAGILTTIVLVALSVIRYSSEIRNEEPHPIYPLHFLIIGAFAMLLVVITALAGHSIYS